MCQIYGWSDADCGRVLPDHCSHRIDIRQLDFVALRAAGYRGAVVDKDNCLVRLPSSLGWERVFEFGCFFQTLPHRDELVPELTVSAGRYIANLRNDGSLTR